MGVADLGMAFEAGLEATEDFDLKAASAVAVAESEAPGVFERMADGADVERSARCEERAGDGREEVGVFVGVEVGDVDAGALEFLDLGEGFALDVLFADVAAKEGLEEVDEGGTEGLAVGAEEGGDGRRGETGMPSVRTMWQPTPRVGLAWATATASSKAEPVAMRVAEVRTRAWWSSAMARLTPGVRPKSSALMMRRGAIGMR